VRNHKTYSATNAKINFGKLLKELKDFDIIVKQYGEIKAVITPYKDREKPSVMIKQNDYSQALSFKRRPVNLPKDLRVVIEELKKKHPKSNIVFNKNKDGVISEIICEIIQSPDFSKAVAVINKSLLHYHKTLTETYLVTKGILNVEVENKEFTVKVGESVTFYPYQKHRTSGNATWIEVYSQPGWRLQDHILV